MKRESIPCNNLTWWLPSAGSPGIHGYATNGLPIRKKPFMLACTAEAVYGKNGNSGIFADYTFGLFELTRDYKELWRLDIAKYGIPRAIDYHQGRYTLIAFLDEIYAKIGSKNRIVEIKDGKVKRELLRTSKGPFESIHFRPGGIRYDPINPDKYIWLSEWEKHFVCKVDWDGNIIQSFGEYGVRGSDDIHLDCPTSVVPCQFQKRLWIGDRNNHRILLINPENMRIVEKYPHPCPVIFELFDNVGVCYGDYWDLGFPIQFSYIFWTDGLKPLCLISEPSNTMRAHPMYPRCYLMTWENGAFEVTLNNGGTSIVNPLTLGIWNKKVIEAKVAVHSIPIVDYYLPNKNFFIATTEAGTLEIEVPRMVKGANSAWDGNWDVIDKVSLKANRGNSYGMKYPVGVCRLKVVLDTKGTISGWVILSPP